jgi:hypothetical protein
VKRSTRASEVLLRSGDIGILRSCQEKLVDLGIACRPLIRLKAAGERDGTNGPIYRRDYWSLAIYRQAAVNHLFELISPYMRHAKRRNDMMMAWDNLRLRRNLLP